MLDQCNKTQIDVRNLFLVGGFVNVLFLNKNVWRNKKLVFWIQKSSYFLERDAQCVKALHWNQEIASSSLIRCFSSGLESKFIARISSDLHVELSIR